MLQIIQPVLTLGGETHQLSHRSTEWSEINAVTGIPVFNDTFPEFEEYGIYLEDILAAIYLPNVSQETLSSSYTYDVERTFQTPVGPWPAVISRTLRSNRANELNLSLQGQVRRSTLINRPGINQYGSGVLEIDPNTGQVTAAAITTVTTISDPANTVETRTRLTLSIVRQNLPSSISLDEIVFNDGSTGRGGR